MGIYSFEFWLLVFLTFILTLILKETKRYIVILIASLIYFYFNSKWLVIWAIITALITYFASLLISKEEDKKKRKTIYLISLISILGILIFLKYLGLFNEIFNTFKLGLKIKTFMLPIGISYYTLEAIGFLTNAYNNKIKEKYNLLKVLTYVLYFPKLLMGPFTSYDNMQDLFEKKKVTYKEFRINLTLILIGFIKIMVFSRRLDIFIAKVDTLNATSYQLILSGIFYTFSLYLEFSGFIDIMKGVSNLFGVRLPENFNSPFLSTSIAEFWRRWHISLGNYFKTYVFYPLTLSKHNQNMVKKTREKFGPKVSSFLSTAYPLLIVWILTGLWHGASFKYLLYGLYYYSIMMIALIIKPLFIKFNKFMLIDTKVYSYILLLRIRTFILVVIGMLLFKSKGVTEFLNILKNIFVYTPVNFTDLGLKNIEYLLLFIGFIFFIIFSHLKEHKINILEKLDNQNLYFRWLLYLFLILTLLCLGVYGDGFAAGDFIYGGF